MTETKRFLIDDAGELIDLNNHKFIDYGDECCKLLNELSDENERLKKYNNKLMKQPLLFDVQTIPNTMEIMEANNKLEEENKQLKQQLNRLYNYFEDWYSDMTSVNDFNEIWDNVKEDERWGDV